jgi:hypothetical protein
MKHRVWYGIRWVIRPESGLLEKSLLFMNCPSLDNYLPTFKLTDGSFSMTSVMILNSHLINHNQFSCPSLNVFIQVLTVLRRNFRNPKQFGEDWKEDLQWYGWRCDRCLRHSCPWNWTIESCANSIRSFGLVTWLSAEENRSSKNPHNKGNKASNDRNKTYINMKDIGSSGCQEIGR